MATHEDLKTGYRDWRVRMEIDGKAVESAGWEPFYLDLILSKTPIVPEGDGAIPVEPVQAPRAGEGDENDEGDGGK